MAKDGVDAIEDAWRRERPDVDPSSIGIITRVWRLGTHLRRARERAMAELDTDDATLDLVATLRRAGPPYRLTAGQLQRACLVTTGAISQRLDKAAAQGLVSRTRDPADRRGVHVQLTDAGRDLADRVYAGLMAREDAYLEAFSPEQRAQLTDLLRHWLLWWEQRV